MQEVKGFWDGKKSKISLSVPNLSDDILEKVKECIDTGWIVKGNFVAEFEKTLAQYTKLSEVVTVQSGTAALHEAYRLLGVNTDDEVIVPNVTFIATVNPAVYLKAHPIFIDCDDTLNMDLDKLEDFLKNECEVRDGATYNKKTDRIIKVLTVVHLLGNLIDMERVISIADKYKLKVLEDAAQAMGCFYTTGKYKGNHAGTIGDIGVISFNANKIITAAGGGAILSKNPDLLQEARYLSMVAKTSSPYIYHDNVGYNYNLTNIQGAFGVSQMKRLEDFVEAKLHNYNLYRSLLKDIKGIKFLEFNKNSRSNHWYYTIIVDEEEYGISRNKLFEKFNEAGIQTGPLWGIMSEQKPFKNYQSYKIEKSKFYVKNALHLPCSTNLKEEEVFEVVKVLKEFSRHLTF